MGYVDLHCHYLPGLDDGVRSLKEGLKLCALLKQAGFESVAATPHMRPGMFDNDAANLREQWARFKRSAQETQDSLQDSLDNAMPTLLLGAEHFFDDIVWERIEQGHGLRYTGDNAILIEFPDSAFPIGAAEKFFQLQVRDVAPVLAHPERYAPLFARTDALDPLLDAGALPLLDVMSLVGHYGAAPQRAAERMVEEGVYFAACSDAHRPQQVDLVVQGIERLTALVGTVERDELLKDNPRHILAGTAAY